MRIIRFIDEQGQMRFGRAGENGRAAVLDGSLPGTLRETGRETKVVKLLAPVDPTAILCIGLNYRKHAEETNTALPDHPILFMKNPAALTNPGDPIVLPTSCVNPHQVDYECELAVVIGKDAKNVKERDALKHVLGYTAANDVSARTWQKNSGGGQWVRGKSFDTFCPVGPVLVTGDELANPQSLRITTRLNGQVMQDENTADMIFPVAELIARLSCGMTLRAGTIILTGTPSGVGVAKSPQVFLKPGDVVDVEIERIGTLSNPVEEES